MARRREVFQRSEMYTPVRWRLVESLRPPPTNSRTSPTDGDEKPEGEKRKYKKRARKQTGMPVPLVASAAEEDKTPSPVDPSRFTLPPSEREPSPPSSDLPNYPPSSPATHSFTRTPLSSYNLHPLQLPSSHSGGGALMFRSERVDSSFNPPRQLTTLTPESSFPLPTRLSSSNAGDGVSMFRPEGLNLGLTDPTRLFHDSTFANLIQTVHLPHEESSLPPIVGPFLSPSPQSENSAAQISSRTLHRGRTTISRICTIPLELPLCVQRLRRSSHPTRRPGPTRRSISITLPLTLQPHRPLPLPHLRSIRFPSPRSKQPSSLSDLSIRCPSLNANCLLFPLQESVGSGDMMRTSRWRSGSRRCSREEWMRRASLRNFERARLEG